MPRDDCATGEQLVSEFYAQLSKFSTWIIFIVQQYSRFQQSGIRPIAYAKPDTPELGSPVGNAA